MSSSPEQQENDAAAHYLRDLLVRFLVDASASEPRVMQASGALEQVVQAALARHDATLKEQLARIERELAALRQVQQQSSGRGGKEDLALTLQHVRGEVALLGEHVQRLSRHISGQGGSGAGTGVARWWRPALITLVSGAALLCLTYLTYATYLQSHRQPALLENRPQLQSQPPAELAAPAERSRRRGVVAATAQGSTSSAAEPLAAGHASLTWEHVWDQAVTQPFSCPGDPGATTLLQCACPEVHPAPPAGYPYEGVGERCPPGPVWHGHLAVAALQAVLKLEEPEAATNIDGLAPHLYPALDKLAERCSLQLGPEVQATPAGPDAGIAAVRVLAFLRSNPGCLTQAATPGP